MCVAVMVPKDLGLNLLVLSGHMITPFCQVQKWYVKSWNMIRWSPLECRICLVLLLWWPLWWPLLSDLIWLSVLLWYMYAVHTQGCFQWVEKYRVTTERTFVARWSCRWNFTSTKIKVKLTLNFILIHFVFNKCSYFLRSILDTSQHTLVKTKLVARMFYMWLILSGWVLKDRLKAELPNIQPWIINVVTRMRGYKWKEKLYE